MHDFHTVITWHTFGAQGLCRGVDSLVTEKCVPMGTSYSLVETLLLKDVSFRHSAQRRHRQTDEQTDDTIMPIAACSTIG